MLSRSFVAVLLPLIISCFTYGGAATKPVTPKEGVAILLNDDDSHISIDVIDGQRKGVKSHGKYEFQPGDHTIRVRLFYRKGRAEWSSQNFLDYAFHAEPGTVLNVVCSETRVDSEHATWQMWIEDMATGKRVSGRKANAVVAPIDTAELERAFAGVREKAVQGDAEAQYALGVLYEKGEGVAQDSAASVSWYLKAAGQGHATAQFSVGLGYELGVGVPQDTSEAFVWFSLAAASGDPSAPLFRDEDEKALTPEMLEKANVRIKELEAEIRAKLPKP